MRSLLVGNGLNCQFDNNNYSAKQIVLRILKNCNREDFPTHIVIDQPYLLKEYIGKLFISARDMLLGRSKTCTIGNIEKEAYKSFVSKYSSSIKSLKITDICFEDYYLLHDLLCHSFGVGNPDQYYIRESMRAAYLFAIYNDGALNNLHMKYPQSLVEFLSSFDKVFTTNYDTNIENATGKYVIHLHGQFDCLNDVYNEESLRNKLPDAPINDIEIDPKYYYLYCNAITTHSGNYKEYIIHQNTNANSGIEKMAEAYKNDINVKAKIDSWLADDNQLVRNLASAVIVKTHNHEICFSEHYHFDEFASLTGDLEILGVSPWNDFHIFKTIDESHVERCFYYYHSEKSRDKIMELFPNLMKAGKLIFKSAEEFWRNQV